MKRKYFLLSNPDAAPTLFLTVENQPAPKKHSYAKIKDYGNSDEVWT